MPATAVVPIVALGVVQVKLTFAPAFAVGLVLFILTITLDVAVHPLLPVTVTEYVVAVVALVVGCAMLTLFNAVAGLHA